MATCENQMFCLLPTFHHYIVTACFPNGFKLIKIMCLFMLLISYLGNVVFHNTFNCKLFLYTVKSITTLLFTCNAEWQLVKTLNVLKR